MFFGKPTPIGIDIGSSLIKLAKVNIKKSGYELTHLSSFQVTSDAITDGIISDYNAILDMLRRAITDAKANKSLAVISVSGHSSVIIKKITLPVMKDDELALSIKFEAEQYIPFDINEVNIDFQILGPSIDRDGQMDVLLVAVKRKVVDEFTELLVEAGLMPAIIDVESLALNNVYEVNYFDNESKNVAIVNIGANSTNLLILQEKMPVFTRSSPIGSMQHTIVLQKSFNVSAEDAERLKKGLPIESVDEGDAKAALGNASDEIIIEIYKSLDYFRSSLSNIDMQEIYVSGGTSLIPGFSEQMEERLRIPVKILDPLRNFDISPKLDQYMVREVAPLSAVAIGLAIRRPGDRV